MKDFFSSYQFLWNFNQNTLSHRNIDLKIRSSKWLPFCPVLIFINISPRYQGETSNLLCCMVLIPFWCRFTLNYCDDGLVEGRKCIMHYWYVTVEYVYWGYVLSNWLNANPLGEMQDFIHKYDSNCAIFVYHCHCSSFVPMLYFYSSP